MARGITANVRRVSAAALIERLTGPIPEQNTMKDSAPKATTAAPDTIADPEIERAYKEYYQPGALRIEAEPEVKTGEPEGEQHCGRCNSANIGVDMDCEEQVCWDCGNVEAQGLVAGAAIMIGSSAITLRTDADDRIPLRTSRLVMHGGVLHTEVTTYGYVDPGIDARFEPNLTYGSNFEEESEH